VDVRFEEKQWMPLWVVAIFVLVPMAICSPLIYANPHSALAWGFAPAIGLLLAIVFWLSTARRWIRVDGRALLIGDRKPIPLTEITEAREVEGRELRRMRQAMIQGRGLSPGAAGLPAVPAAGGALGSLALGYGLLRGRSRAGNTWGMLAQPWMRQAVLVAAPSNARAPVLLIGTRRPQELLAALRSSPSPNDVQLDGAQPLEAAP
jgi:hypothetical protein